MYYHNLNILVPIDFSEASLNALRQAIGLLRVTGGELTVMHVGITPNAYPTDFGPIGTAGAQMLALGRELATEMQHALDRVCKQEIPESITHKTLVREGFPPSEILAQLQEGEHSLLVMGTHGRTGIKRVLLGSVTERVLRRARSPVMVLRALGPNPRENGDARTSAVAMTGV